MIKKIVAIFLSIILTVSLVACNQPTNTIPAESIAATAPNQTETQAQPTEAATYDDTTELTVPETAPTEPDATTQTTSPTEAATVATEPGHTHSYTHTAIAPTCTNDGYVNHACSCGDTYVSDKTAAIGHKFGEWTTTLEPTATATGLAERECANCGSKETKTLGKVLADHTHSYTDKITQNATCTSEGVKTFTCSCGDSYTEAIAKISHSYKKTVVKPTCESDGYTTNQCSACGSAYVSDRTTAVGHSFGEWKTTKEPTTASTGIAERKCNTCGASETRTLSQLVDNHAHSYTETVTRKATCTAYGLKTFTCSCGDQYTERIGKVKHQYNAVVKAPTCTEWGYTTHTCSACGNSYKDGHAAPLNHDYNVETVKATCETDGYEKYTCTRCGDTYTNSETTARGHSYYTVSDIGATCTEDGAITEECSRCGDEKITVIKAEGHTVKTLTTEAFCGNDGYVYEYCSVCSTEITDVVIPAPGAHKYVPRVVGDVVKEQMAKDNYRNSQYVNCTDWLVDQCEVCGKCSMGDMYFRYTDYEAAVIMLGYVNDLRAEVYGTHRYDLVLDDTLLDLAKIRSKEISTNYSHWGGTYTNAGENIVASGYNIYDQFCAWKESAGHYENMIEKHHQYFGYAYYNAEDITMYIKPYGVQLFWSPDAKDLYYN